jgi:DNA transformation protein and related proteins
MSANPELIGFVRDLLNPLGDIQEGSFFGGFAFKYNHKQFAMIMGNTLYLCVDIRTRPKYEALGMMPFSYTTKKGLVNVKKYYSAPEHLFEDQDQLISWAHEAIQAAHAI